MVAASSNERVTVAAPDSDSDPAIGAFLRDCRAMAKKHVPCVGDCGALRTASASE